MNRQQFISYMSAPDTLTEKDGKEIKDIIKEFPYFQTAHLLLTKSLHNQKSIHYNNQLKIAAAYATNRKKLHTLITSKYIPVVEAKHSVQNITKEISKTILTETNNKEKQQIPAVVNAQKPELVSKTVDVSIPKETEVLIKKTEPETAEKNIEKVKTLQEVNTTVTKEIDQNKTEEATSLIVPPSNAVSLEHIEKPAETNKEEKIATVNITEVVTSETEIKPELEIIEVPNNAVFVKEESSAAIASEKLEKEYLAEIALTTVELEITTPNIISDVEYVDDVIETDFILNSPTKNLSEVPETNKTEHSFIGWLTQMSDISAEKSTKEPSLATSKEEVKQNIAKPKDKPSLDLIDKFLKEEPRIKVKKEFYSPINMARQSVAEDITLVSETLAKIYLLQESYTKALDAYEHLRLKYPEKRFYFAAQIKKIRKLIKQNNPEK